MLKHPIRRAILKQLSSGPISYSEILKNLKIPESSILNYHLRELSVLLIKKDVNGKYELNEVGKICLQLVVKVKEKEDFQMINKLQSFIIRSRLAMNFFQITTSVLIIILVLVLCFKEVFNISRLIWMLVPQFLFCIVLTNAYFKASEKIEINYIHKIDKGEKLAMFSFLFTIEIIALMLFELMW